MEIKVILTGATGLVGEGVLLTCLAHPNVKEVLMVNRREFQLTHPKLKELLVDDFMELATVEEQLSGYDACFYCAGISSNGINETDYTKITYDTPLSFAQTLVRLNPDMVFGHISGGYTDSSEKGKVMWARVKGRAENALMKLPFKKVYNFRPGFMKTYPEQRNAKGYYRAISSIYPLLLFLFPNHVSTMAQLGLAMVNSVLKGYEKPVLEVKDIKELAC